MAERRNDPRWRWLTAACDRLYAELEPRTEIGVLTITIVEPDGGLISYGVNPHDDEVTRVVVPDPVAWATAAFPGTIDATVREEDTDHG